MATSKRPPGSAAGADQVTTISASGDMRKATPEEAEALAASMRFAAAERQRRDGFDAASEPLDDPRMEGAARKPSTHQPRKPAAKRAPRKASATRHAAAEAGSPDSTGADASAPTITLAEALNRPMSATASEILETAGLLAFSRRGQDDLALGLVTLFKACISVGLNQAADENSSPQWLCSWLGERKISTSALRTFAEQRRRSTLGDTTQVRLSPNATAILGRAAALAAFSNTVPLLGARHLLLAILDHTEIGAGTALRTEFRKAFRQELDQFRQFLISQVIAYAQPDENLALWRELHDTPLSDLLVQRGDQPPAARVATISGFHADRATTSGSDPLGIQADVTAFARLICLEEAKPPLSIGIFGEWGSGKSSFMERLQLEITDLTRKEREAREKARKTAEAAPVGAAPAAGAPMQPAAPRFIENAVQIRFNAWHYADANLWASLTAEFFDQLRRGGHEGQRSSDYLALIGKVAERVRSLEASAQKAEDKLADAERAARHADEALASARKKLAASDLALASEHLAETLDGIRKEKQNADKLKEVGRRIYRDDLGDDLDSFTAAVSEASTIPGKVALVARVMAGGGLPSWLGAFAIVLVAVAGIGWRLGDPTSLAVLLQRAIAWGGGTLAALGSLWQAVKLAKPVLDGAWEYAKAVEKARKELAKEVEDKEVAARDAARALVEAQQKAEEAKAPLAKYGDGAATGAPSTILRYFLFEDGDVRDYDKQVGLVSRARRSFEQLDAIFTANRDGLAARDKQARGEALKPAEVEALARHEKMQLDKQGLVIPDRIVLYIDDLDRCTHQQVYDVLQAIHLLLAFELFVVVVGVDVRWVEEAVARQFTPAAHALPDNATAAEHEAARQTAETERRMRAIDYLEKIFQLPFWLRRLSTEGDKGGSYGAYVKELLQANLQVPENAPSPLASIKRDPASQSFRAGDGVAGDSLGDEEDDTELQAEELASVDLALATVRLTQAEVDFLASPEIGAIAFKSPRSVKRMLNVYRIVRARMSETELNEFLGRNGQVATWPLAAFCAAVETGQPVEIADLLYDGLKAAAPHEMFTAVSLEAIIGEDKQSGLVWIAKADELAGNVLSVGIHALNARRGHREMSADWVKCGAALATARIVRRYSFNRYH